CKGCKSDCPMNVDVATYKAEFLHHYYKGRARPVTAYSMGLIAWWARLGSLAPGLARGAVAAPGLSRTMKEWAGVAPERRVPRLARRTFRQWHARRAPKEPPAYERGADVLLWPDT